MGKSEMVYKGVKYHLVLGKNKPYWRKIKKHKK